MSSVGATEGAETYDEGCYVALTEKHLDILKIMDKVRSPEAGAVVLFAGQPMPSHLLAPARHDTGC